ncbi:MAG: anti-sigma factor antagonist [Calditrichae bacterium]|nr:anti-sigma factor antagonist [Calditrichia bacterium]
MLKIDVDNKDSVTIVRIEGEVDLYSSPEVRKTILELVNQKPEAIVVNLGQVGYMDSSGLATLVEGLQQVGKYSGKFVLANLRTEVKEVFTLSHLDKVFEIYESLGEALKSVGADGTGN